MHHALSNDVLYAASKIQVEFIDDLNALKIVGGTAFFVMNKKKELCLITNRHVIDLNYKQQTSKYKNYKISKVIVNNKIHDNNNHLPSKSCDLIIINFDDFEPSEKYENDVACLRNIKAIDINGIEPIISYWLDYTLLANRQIINEKLTICDFVAFPGFPEWYDKKNNSPILRTGTIASDPRFNYSNSGNEEGEIIAFEAFSYGGSSGSPVFAIQKGTFNSLSNNDKNYRQVMLVGINAGHLPLSNDKYSHSGISFFYKSSVILDLIDK